MEKDLDKILLFVKEKLIILKIQPTEYDAEVTSFLDELRQSKRISCRRLLVCIGIDLKKYSREFDPKNGLLNCFVEALRIVILDIKNNPLIKSYKSEIIPPSIRFAISLKDKDCFFLSKPFIKSEENHNYFRITTFNSFFRYVILPNLKKNRIPKKKILKDADPNELHFYYWQLRKQKRFHEINVSTLGSFTGWVFVASYDELKGQIIKNNVDYLVDSLGFYTKDIKKSANYVCLQYPKEGFFEATYQPHCLTGDWGKIDGLEFGFGNDFFLSDGEHNDKWGRTRSVTGKYEDQKERTHLQFNYLKSNFFYEFSVQALGKIKSEIGEPNFDKVLHDAIIRFKKT